MATAGDQHLATQLIEQLAAAGVVGMACDSNDRVTAWNEAAAAIFGWSAKEALGRDAAELLVEPNQRDEARAVIAGMRDSGTARRGRFQAVRRDGAPAVLEFAI